MNKVLPPAIGLGALMLVGVLGWQRGDIVVRSDPGGDVAALYAQYYEQWQMGERHAIDGRCASACTMRLIFPNTCATANAHLGFHRSYYFNFFGFKIGSTWGDQFMLDRYPLEIIKWLDSKGGLSHDMKWLEGEELAALVPHC